MLFGVNWRKGLIIFILHLKESIVVDDDTFSEAATSIENEDGHLIQEEAGEWHTS